MAVGMGLSFVCVTVAATSGVPGKQSGLASGLLNTAQQIGGSLGLAILSGVAASATTRYFMHSPQDPATALVHGFHIAYYIAAGFAVSAAVVATLVLKERKGDKGEVDPTAMVGA
jgi:sugar phosphate permease